MRHPLRRLLVALLMAAILASAAYVVGGAWWRAKSDPHLRFEQLLLPRILDVTITAWLLAVGSSVGSFLNVVAWRLPRGESISGRSHCPRCHARLRARDNIPVLGWLLLAGRCRTCRLPISARYPIVEAAVGLSITAIGVAELQHVALPFQSVHIDPSPLANHHITPQSLLTVFYHVVAVSIAWAFALIRWDGRRLPAELVSPGLLALTVPMVAYPALMCVPWQVSVDASWRGDGLHLDAVVRLITAFAAAGVFARSLARGFCPAADPKLDPLGADTTKLIDLLIMVSVPAIVCGWQALPAVLVLASLIARLVAAAHRRWFLPIPQRSGGPSLPWGGRPESRWARPGPSETGGTDVSALGLFAVSLPAAMMIQIACWRVLHQWWAWPSAGSSPALILVASGLALMIPFWLSDTVRDRHPLATSER